MRAKTKHVKQSPRRRAREFAVQALYQATVNQMPAPEMAKQFYENIEELYGEEKTLVLKRFYLKKLAVLQAVVKDDVDEQDDVHEDKVLIEETASEDEPECSTQSEPIAVQTAEVAENSLEILQRLVHELEEAQAVEGGEAAQDDKIKEAFAELESKKNDLLNKIKQSETVCRELFREIFFGVQNNRLEYMNLIRPHLDRDEKDINLIERAILLVACHELKSMPETPYPVVINEAIEVAKTFGGTDGHKFVNGILDKLGVALRPHDPKVRHLSA